MIKKKCESDTDQNWMKIAFQYACYAQKKGEIPVGAVLVFKKRIIGIGWNRSISTNDPTAHAEIIAFRKAGKNLKNYRLDNATLYVTLQPCMMCCGAIIHSRIKKLVFGANCHNSNKIDSFKKILLNLKYNYKLIIKKNIMQNECSKLLKNFFKYKRM